MCIRDRRQGQVGTGDRSEKIRTYNFPQDRCTDHRIGLTVHNLSKIMDGNLDELIDALATREQAEDVYKRQELNALGKPYIILLNSTHPDAPETRQLAEGMARDLSLIHI